MKGDITNVEVKRHTKDKSVLSCDYDGASYHVWVHSDTHEITNGILYKTSLTPKMSERPRMLRVDSKFSMELINRMFAVAINNYLWDKAEDELKQRQTEDAAKVGAAVARDCKRNAAEELYDALAAIGGLPDGYCFCPANRAATKPEECHTGECLDARAALAKAEGKV